MSRNKSKFVNFMERREEKSLFRFMHVLTGLIVTNIVPEFADLSNLLQDQINRWAVQLSDVLHSEPFQRIIQRVSTFYAEKPQSSGGGKR